MKLIIVRHGDPDYSIDSLTEKGHREAKLLSDMLVNIPVDEYYCSPLGRARDTAAPTLERLGRTATVCDWLREFKVDVYGPDSDKIRSVPWDLLPAQWMDDDRYFTDKSWFDTDYIHTGPLYEEYVRVCSGIDEILARQGYFRKGRRYTTEQGNDRTILLFCHFGVESVILSHILNISPVILWHNTVVLPTGVTTLHTEERIKGDVQFRMCEFGSTAHLYAGNEPPAFAGRFCTVYENFDQRHD